MSAENHRHAGDPDRGPLQTSMREAAQKAHDLQRQAEAARASLTEAAVKVQELEQQAAAAQTTITLFQEQEGVIARAFQEAQRASEEVVRTAKARADETVAAAKSAAEGIVHTARTTGAELLQQARASAQEQVQAAEHATAAAKAAAEEIVQTARVAAVDTLQQARASAEEQVQAAEHATAAAKAAAEEIVQAARVAAAETLQQARASAEEQVQAAEHATTGAKAAAEEIVQAARAAAAETLHQARAAADEQIQAAERTAAEILARQRAESDQLLEESNRNAQEVRDAATQYLTGITAKLEAFMQDREHMSRGLEALARNHAESLQIMTRLRSEVQGQILPTVHRLVRRLRGEEGGETDDTTPLPGWSVDPTEAAPAPSGEREAAGQAATEKSAVEPAAPAIPAARHSGEILVSPIHSFLQATKFMTALSQIPGVASVKLRTYSGAKATIEIITEGRTLADIDCTAIDGFAIDVVESTDTHLVLRIASPAARPVHG